MPYTPCFLLRLTVIRILQNYHSTMDKPMNSGEWRNFDYKISDVKTLNQSLMHCHKRNVLVDCLMLDNEWLIPFDYRLFIMEKAKSLGANSKAFLIDYYGYKAAFLGRSEEQQQAKNRLKQLLDS